MQAVSGIGNTLSLEGYLSRPPTPAPQPSPSLGFPPLFRALSHSPLTLLPHPPCLLRTAVTLSLMASVESKRKWEIPFKSRWSGILVPHLFHA